MHASPHRHPGWYGSVMGTGGLSLALAVQATTWDARWLAWGARTALVATTVLAVVLLPRYLARFRQREQLAL